MKRIIIIILALILINVTLLCGCNEEKKELEYSVVGEWITGYIQDVGQTILTLNSDGTAVDRLDPGDITSSGTWELDGDKLTLNLTSKDNTWVFVFKLNFEEDGKLLKAQELSSGNVETWERRSSI